MKKSTKQFERQKLRVRDKIERKGIVLAKSMIRSHYQYFLDKLKQVGINQYDKIEIPESITKHFFNTFYPMSSVLAVMEYEHLEKQVGKKSEPTDKQNILNSIFQSKLTEIVNTTAGKNIATITVTSQEAIKQAIRNVLDIADTEGWGIPEITSKIYKSVGDSLLGNGYARARAIAQTEMISASNQASTEAAERTGLKYKKFWSTSGLPGIRLSHIQAEEFSNSVDGLRPDQTFPNGLLYPGDPNGAPKEVINCYTGDMEIKSAIVSAQKLVYSGNMVKIVTGTGKEITVTPNHYILTENGMVRACDINKSHNLVCNSEYIKTGLRNFINRNNINNKPAIISEVFNSFVIKFASKFRPVVALDFDNDGARGNSDIHIVDANWKLNFSRGMKLFKNIGNFAFKQSDSQRILVERFCRLNFGFSGMFSTSNFIVRFLNLISSLFIGHFTPFKFFGIGLTSNHYTMFSKMPFERDSWNTGMIRDLVKTHSRFIHLDKVAKVEIFKFNGHVYDFTSLTGTNIVNNIYTSNCRCTIMHEIII